MSIKENYEYISGMLPERVTLVAVSKYHTQEEIMQLYRLGQRDFGENKVQDMVAKSEELPADIRWHLIGHLQTNKVKYVIGKTCLIHSLDRHELAREIDKRSYSAGVVTDCLVQVNSTGIESRFGVSPDEAGEFIHSLSEYKNIRVRGIMGMAPITDNPTPHFELLKSIYDKYAPQNGILSMGMSGDFEEAVKCGSTMVRIGNRLFA